MHLECTLASSHSVIRTITTSVLSFIYATSAEEQPGVPAAGSAWLSQIGCLPSLTELTTWVVWDSHRGRGIPSRPENRLCLTLEYEVSEETHVLTEQNYWTVGLEWTAAG